MGYKDHTGKEFPTPDLRRKDRTIDGPTERVYVFDKYKVPEMLVELEVVVV